MTVKIESDYLAEQITKRINSLSSEYYNHMMQEQLSDLYGSDNDAYSKSETMDWVHDTLKRIYILILAYLERQNLTLLADTFIKRYEHQLENPKFMLESGTMPFDESLDSYLLRLREFEDFLLPFRAFDVFREEKRISEHMLEAVLSNTHLILKKSNVTITREASIYRGIEWFLQVIYPESIYVKAPLFPGKFKHYNADLHVPELQTAIEYKLLHTNDNPDNYIDQIRIDAVNYQGDDRYNRFYAVMYFMNNQKHKLETLQSCWRAKQFPANWKPIFVFD